MPVYNVEKYLPRCIDSILAQTFTDFEAILVDDGSPDGCGKIIDEYAQKDSRIIPIHQENKGVSAARNTGLRIAKGEYIGFVDPDDWIEAIMYELLIEKMETEHCDIASCSWKNDYKNGEEKEHPIKLPSQTMSREEYAKHLFDMPPTIAGSTCNKLFQKGLINEKFNEQYKICEDNYFLARYCVNIKKAVHLDIPLYHVFNRDDSATRSIPDRAAEGLPVRREIIGVMRNVSKGCEMRAEHVYLDQCITFCSKNRNRETPYYQLAANEYIAYLSCQLFKLIKNTEIPWKNKLFFWKEYIRLKREKG